MGALPVELVDEIVEARLLLQDVGGGGSRGRRFERQMHALVSPVLLGMARGDPFESNAQPQPPHGQCAQPVERPKGGEGHAIVGPHRLGQAEFLKDAFENREGGAFARALERLTAEEIPTAEIGDRQRITVATILELKFPFEVRAERVRRADA